LVEIKAFEKLEEVHKAQAINYWKYITLLTVCKLILEVEV
jgi:hypothetical protein